MKKVFKQKLQQLLRDNKILSYGAGDQAKSNEIELYFAHKVPRSYKIFLEEIGHAIINGFEFYGTGIGNIPSIIHYDKLHKLDQKYPNMPENYILISDIGDEVKWFIDISAYNANTKEAPIKGYVVGLSSNEQPEWVKEEETFATFEEFFYAKAIEN